MGQATTNSATWHADQSSWRGKPNVNGFSIVIEIVNPGIMQRTPAGEARKVFGQTFEIGSFGVEARSPPEHGSGLWMPYRPEQIEGVIGICSAVTAAGAPGPHFSYTESLSRSQTGVRPPRRPPRLPTCDSHLPGVFRPLLALYGWWFATNLVGA